MQPKFEIATTSQVKLDNAKPRKENHGEAKVLALDLSMTWTTNNKALDLLMPGLREFLFAPMPASADADDQTELDLPVSDLPFIRFPKMTYPIKLEHEFLGWTLRMDFGRGGDADKIVPLCKLKNFQITPIEGGSVEIHFSASSAADITGDLVGAFSEFVQQMMAITLLAPLVELDKPIDSSAGSGAPGVGDGEQKQLEAPPVDKKASKARQSAEEAFIAQHGGGTDTPPVH